MTQNTATNLVKGRRLRLEYSLMKNSGLVVSTSRPPRKQQPAAWPQRREPVGNLAAIAFR